MFFWIVLSVALIVLILFINQIKAPDQKDFPHDKGQWIVGNTIELWKEYDLGPERALMQTHKHGLTWTSTIMTQPLFIYTADPAIVEHVLKTNFDNYEKGPRFRRIFRELLGDGIFNSDGAQWYHQRKIASKLFSVRNFRDILIHAFMSQSEKFISKLTMYTETKRTTDMQDWFLRFTLDSIGMIAFGVTIGSLDGNDAFFKPFDECQRHVVKRVVTPLWEYLSWISPEEWKFQKNIKKLHEYCDRVVIQRMEQREERVRLSSSSSENIEAMFGEPMPEVHSQNDLLSLFMEVENEDDRNLNYKSKVHFYRDLMMNFILAGRDTTAQTLSWMLYEIARNKEIETKMLEEIDRVTLSNSLPINFQLLKQMKYIDAVILETVRLYPAVPIDVKMAVKDDILPNGWKIEAGWWISYMPYVMARMESLWPNALKFNPERWFEPENHNPSPFKFISFNAGPRICLGRDMAKLEAKCVIVMLLQKFKFELVLPPGVDCIKPETNITLPMRGGLPMRVSLR